MNCVSPFYILNPVLIRDRMALKGYTLVVTPIKTFRWSLTYYPSSVFKPFSRCVCPDNVDSFFVTNDITGDTISLFVPVPCGKCDCCRVNSARDLQNRMLLETVGRSYNPVFITLTYDSFNLPHWGVNKRDVQLFLKRLRFKLSQLYPHIRLKYIIVSEYGSLRGRPHYHGILYGLDFPVWELYKDIFPLIDECWGKGFTLSKVCNSNAFSYISKYMYKFQDIPLDQNPNFRLFSRMDGGFGSHCLRNPDFFKAVVESTGTVTFPILGKLTSIKVPPFILNKVFMRPEKYYGSSAIDAFHTINHAFDVLSGYILHYDLDVDSIINTLDIPDYLKDDLTRSEFSTFDSFYETFWFVTPRTRNYLTTYQFKSCYPIADMFEWLQLFEKTVTYLVSLNLDVTFAYRLEQTRLDFLRRRKSYLDLRPRDSSNDVHESFRIINSYKHSSYESSDLQ